MSEKTPSLIERLQEHAAIVHGQGLHKTAALATEAAEALTRLQAEKAELERDRDQLVDSACEVGCTVGMTAVDGVTKSHVMNTRAEKAESALLQAREDAQRWKSRYDYVRALTVPQFQYLYQRCMKDDLKFDDQVDAARQAEEGASHE